MRNWKIIEKQVCVYEDEVKEVEKYVEKKNGKILWGFMREACEKEDEEIEFIFYINREGIIAVPLRDI